MKLVASIAVIAVGMDVNIISNDINDNDDGMFIYSAIILLKLG